MLPPVTFSIVTLYLATCEETLELLDELESKLSFAQEIENTEKIDKSNISKVLKGKLQQTKGYIFEIA